MREKIGLIAIAGSLMLASGTLWAGDEHVSAEGQGTELRRYSECYLESFYAGNILQMRYQNMSRFELADIISEKNTNLEDNVSANQINKDVAGSLEAYIDEVYSMAPETDDNKITAMSRDYMKRVLDDCLVRKKVNTGR